MTDVIEALESLKAKKDQIKQNFRERRNKNADDYSGDDYYHEVEVPYPTDDLVSLA